MTAQYPAAYKYVQAKGYTEGRPDGRPLWVVIHTMEAHELSDTAEGTANYFATMPDDRQVSSHLCIDNDTAIQCVDVYDSAWTVGNRPGNRRGLNYEHAGFASQTAAGWADDYSTAMLRLSAKCARSDVLRFGIPVRRCTVDQLKAFEPGFTTHNDLRLAFGVTTHTDPGQNFPWTRYLDMVRAELEGDMALDDADKQWLLANLGPQPVASKIGIDLADTSSGIARGIVARGRDAVTGVLWDGYNATKPLEDPYASASYAEQRAMRNVRDTLRGIVGGPVDQVAIVAAVAQLAALVQQQSPASAQQIAVALAPLLGTIQLPDGSDLTQDEVRQAAAQGFLDALRQLATTTGTAG